MAEREDEPTESPATWENVVVGKVKQVIGHTIRDEELVEEGEEQEEVAHEVHAEAEVEHEHEHEHHQEKQPGHQQEPEG
jgi:uncharacterized protein YjbJ (UPF0337 family)